MTGDQESSQIMKLWNNFKLSPANWFCTWSKHTLSN